DFSNGGCLFSSAAAADGSFSLNVPVLDGPMLVGSATGSAGGTLSSLRAGSTTLDGCPSGAVTLRASDGADVFALSLSLAAGKISWAPGRPASSLFITHPGTGTTWQIDGQFNGPVTYATVPAGA